jgi:hypothetical protein
VVIIHNKKHSFFSAMIAINRAQMKNKNILFFVRSVFKMDNIQTIDTKYYNCQALCAIVVLIMIYLKVIVKIITE